MENKNIYQRILIAQSKIEKIDRDSVNPHFRSKYTSLENVLSKALPQLTEQGILFTSVVENEVVTIKLINVDNPEQFVSTSIPIIFESAKNMQKLGSCITYSMRYGILSLLGLCPDIDDDGNAACNDKKEVKTIIKKEVKEEVKLQGKETNYYEDALPLFELKLASIPDQYKDKIITIFEKGFVELKTYEYLKKL